MCRSVQRCGQVIGGVGLLPGTRTACLQVQEGDVVQHFKGAGVMTCCVDSYVVELDDCVAQGFSCTLCRLMGELYPSLGPSSLLTFIIATSVVFQIVTEFETGLGHGS